MSFVEAENLCVGGVELGAIRVGPGDWVDIRWPCVHGGAEEQALIGFVTGRAVDAEGVVRVRASVAFPWLILRRRFPWGREARLGALRRACAEELVDDWDALESEFGWERDDRPSSLPGTPKVLMALLLGMSESKLVLFSTGGLDPCGVERVEGFVDEVRGRSWGFVRCLGGEGGVEVSWR